MTNSEFDTDYVQWKKWTWIEKNSPFLDRYYRGEMDRAGWAPGERVLEVGFGEGGFMLWCRENGIEISGLEVISERCEEARKHGYNARYLNLASRDEEVVTFVKESAGSFHKVVAFDVLEHLDLDQLDCLLSHAKILLIPGGKIIARVPNASSPFGCIIQNGDITHKTAFTQSSLRQIAQPSGFRCTFFGNAYRGYTRKVLLPMFWLVYGCRNLIEWGIGHLYWLRRVPMDQVVTFHLEVE